MRIVRTRIESAIESARGCESVIEEKEFAIEIAKETGIAKGPVVVIETEDKRIIEAVAETGRIEIEAGTAIVTEIDIGIGNGSKKENVLVTIRNFFM